MHASDVSRDLPCSALIDPIILTACAFGARARAFALQIQRDGHEGDSQEPVSSVEATVGQDARSLRGGGTSLSADVEKRANLNLDRTLCCHKGVMEGGCCFY